MKNLFTLCCCLAVFSFFSCEKEELAFIENNEELNQGQFENERRGGLLAPSMSSSVSTSQPATPASPSGPTGAPIPPFNPPPGTPASQTTTTTPFPPSDVQTLEYDPKGIIIFNDNP